MKGHSFIIASFFLPHATQSDEFSFTKVQDVLTSTSVVDGCIAGIVRLADTEGLIAVAVFVFVGADDIAVAGKIADRGK